MTRLFAIAPAILLAPAIAAQTPDHSQHAPPPTQQAAPSQQAPQHEDHSGHTDHKPAVDPHAGHDIPQPPGPAPMDHSTMDHSNLDQGAHEMRGALGAYPMSREGSGTSWVPDASTHGGVHGNAGDWMLMGHANLDAVHSSQNGPRGDDKTFVAGMFMGTARRDFANGDALQFRGMISPDPTMGQSGYPLLLAAGETADGVEPLVDRQHPHDLFMELSASYSKKLTDTDSVFLYAGLPGEPAFGPPAFMHRPAAMASPEAPITHHWIDSTHITFGVLTAGWVHDGFKVEASQFRGREPDQDRYDIETGELDSTAVRVSWNPNDNWALQASWADMTSPEQLEPDVDVTKYSASALYTRRLENGGEIAFTGAFARRDNSENVSLDAWLGEASFKPNADWTLFSRAEAVETDELGLIHHGPIENVAKLSLGLVRDFRVAEHVTLGIGALVSQNWTSGSLSPLYGGDPMGGMAFVRLKIG